jgi:hypothetical protein
VGHSQSHIQYREGLFAARGTAGLSAVIAVMSWSRGIEPAERARANRSGALFLSLTALSLIAMLILRIRESRRVKGLR